MCEDGWADVHPALGNSVVLIPTSRNSASFMIDNLDGIRKSDRSEGGKRAKDRSEGGSQVLTRWKSLCLDGLQQCFAFCCHVKRRLDAVFRRVWWALSMREEED